jgi:predicted DNA-binding WGR domain protein
MSFQDFLAEWNAEERVATEDVLASFLPLGRDVLAAHEAGRVAPLEGLAALRVERSRLFFAEADRLPPRHRRGEVERLERASRLPVEVLSEARRTVAGGDDGEELLINAEVAERGAPITRPVYLPGYVSWEHEVGHHDPLTDIYSLGLLLASLACQLDLTEPEALATFVAHRRNLFALRPDLHPVLAQAVARMTELDRHRRAQDLPALLQSLESYRDQSVSFAVDLARQPGFRQRDRQGRQQLVLARLRDRLFDLSRRNRLLHFRPSQQSVNLTQASVPLLLDIRNIREEQILTWGPRLHRQLADGEPLSLNKHLNFNEALYLPSQLERILADARRDQREVGFAELRLVLAFLAWADLKEKPAERYTSPLVLLPVRLVKSKGIRDSYLLEPLSTEAEVNPVLRYQLRQLYGLELPEAIDLATTSLEALHELLAAQIRASEPAVTLTVIDRPRIDLVHEKAKRRLDQYRRSARVAGRGVRHFGDLDYSYDPANYHPLGVKLFAARVRTPGSRLREIVEQRPRARSFAAGAPAGGLPQIPPATGEAHRTFFQLREAAEDNPYLWSFDLCNLTLANFRYRRMSLARDYERLLEGDWKSGAFEATFSLAPRPVDEGPAAALPLAERFDVVACDPTQGTAVAQARRGRSYIVQGPPGTGKSQTIANLIADFVARGRRVLFVCEKRAALDVVYARLAQCGLGSLCCLIHDSQTDKKEFILDLKETYGRLLGEGSAASSLPAGWDGSGRAGALARMDQDLAELDGFARSMAGELPGTDLPVRQFLDHAIDLAASRPPLTAEELEGVPRYSDWWPHAARLARLELAIRDFEPDGILARHPLRRLSPALAGDDRPIERVAEGARQALAALDALEREMAASGLPAAAWSAPGRLAPLLAYGRLAEPLVREGNLALAEPRTERSRRFAEAGKRVGEAAAKLAKARPAAGGWREKLLPADLATALVQARAFEGKALAWLSPAWWRLRGALGRRYDFAAHAVRPGWTAVLAALEQEYQAGETAEEAVRAAREAFGIDGDFAAFEGAVAALRAAFPGLPDWLRAIHAGLAQGAEDDDPEGAVARLLAAAEPAHRLDEELSRFLVDVADLSPAELRRDLEAIGREARQVPALLGVLGELAALPSGVASALRRLPWSFRQIEAAAAHRSFEELRRSDRRLDRFDSLARGRHSRALEGSYRGWLRANAGEIRGRVRDRFLDHVRLAGLPAAQLDREEKDFKRRYAQGRRTLEHEFGKTLRHRSIRELLDGDSALVVQDLKPVWLMSPLSVSDTFRLAPGEVDVVIFDEASQVPLEESIPALFRGEQVIVVGDPMQLPPTDFFSSRERPGDEDEVALEEDGVPVTYDLDSDSFLNHAARNLPSTLLGWHYRSRSEALIHFSNQAFYEGRLLTVPDRAGVPGADPAAERAGLGRPAGVDLLLARPLSFHRLPAGLYENRTNRAEAEAIAALVRGLLRRRQGLSLGVIAFSEAQQAEIEAALDRLAQDDEEFRALYEEELQREDDGQFVGLLVKNLENVQGDERDVVILSICYGPGRDGRMLMNFGPINKSGGEKRLNVAFSRARHHMAVVSSIEAGAITNDYNEGASCLKSFLRYAEAASRGDLDGARRAIAAVHRGRPAAPLGGGPGGMRGELAAALRERGYRVEEEVGQSHFRVDLAVRRPDDRAHRLGILLDPAERYERVETLEREMMRPRLLRDFGWRLASVLAKDWYVDPERELARILALLEEDGDQDEAANEGGDEEAGEEEALEPAGEPREPATVVEPAVSIEAAAPVAGPRGSAEAPADPTAGRPQPPANAAAPRRFEYQDERSSKFWEIAVAGPEHSVRFGRLGTAGQSKVHGFATAAEARLDADRLIREKVRKGYREVAG